MPEILRLFFIIVLLTIGFAAYFLVVTALFPQRVAKTKSVIQSTPGRSFGIGLVNFVFFAVIALALFALSDQAQAGIIKGIVIVPALLITAFLAIMLSFGLAAISHSLGERILPHLTTLKQRAWGTVCLGLACAVPFVGWFLLLPYVGFLAVGAVILGFFQRES